MKTPVIIATGLLFVIAFAGCIGSDTSQVTSALTGATVGFTMFYPVAPEVYAGNDITIYMQVQNNGYFDSSEVKAKLYNCGEIRDGTRMSTGDAYICNSEFTLADSLTKPDQELGVAGEVAEEEIALTTSGIDFPQGRSPHTFSARLEYDYSATATRDVVFTTFDNWREKSGALETGMLTSFSSPAPISMVINAPDTPIIISDPAKPQEFTIAVNIANTGGGHLVPDRQLEYVKLCYDPNFVNVAEIRDFGKVYYCYVKDTDSTAFKWSADSSLEGYSRIKPDKKCDQYTSCASLCTANGYYNSDTLVEKASADGYCECSYVDVNNCLWIKDPDKRTLIGLTQQWRDYDVQFETNKDSALVQGLIQDISSFDATTEYRYSTDTSTAMTVIN